MSAALRFRLVGVDCPERGQDGYAEARAYVEDWCDLHRPDGLRAITYKADSFGRWLADVYYRDDAGNVRSLSAALLLDGHAEPYSR